MPTTGRRVDHQVQVGVEVAPLDDAVARATAQGGEHRRASGHAIQGPKDGFR
jgi:hypothetical protein